MSEAHAAPKHPYHLVDPSPWPIIGAFGGRQSRLDDDGPKFGSELPDNPPWDPITDARTAKSVTAAGLTGFRQQRKPTAATAEAHPGLWHLVSYVHGRLRPGVGDGTLLRATFPPGSVTGAPKVQSLKVIADLEPTGREVYTGAVGFASPLAGLELNVAIRTLELADGRIWLGAGGGIVADSDPRSELQEALAKARPIAAAVGRSVLVDGVRAPHVRRAA